MSNATKEVKAMMDWNQNKGKVIIITAILTIIVIGIGMALFGQFGG